MGNFIITGMLLGLSVFGAPAEAHSGKDRMKLQCDNNGCTVTAIKHKHGHRHHHHHGRKSKMKFVGDVCRYRPWSNITVCKC